MLYVLGNKCMLRQAEVVWTELLNKDERGEAALTYT